MPRTPIITLTVAVSMGTGCGTKEADCTRLDHAVTRGAMVLKGAEDTASRKAAPDQTARETRAYAKTVQEQSRALDGVSIEDAGLKTLVGKYQTLAADVSSKADVVAGVYDEYAQLEKQHRELGKKWSTAYDGVKSACEAKSDDCDAFAALGDAPSGGADAELARRLEAWASRVDALEVSKEADELLSPLVRSTRAYAAHLKEWAEADAKLAKSDQALEASFQKEKPIVDEITAYCSAG